MTSDDLKLERLKARQRKAKRTNELLMKVLDNPVAEFAALIALLELWYRYKAQYANNVMLDFDAMALFTAGSGIIAAKQLAPVLPQLVNAGGDLINKLPALAALALK